MFWIRKKDGFIYPVAWETIHFIEAHYIFLDISTPYVSLSHFSVDNTI